MFTGIIEQVGIVRSISDHALAIQCEGSDWMVGESISINGCCLTLLGTEQPLRFDLSSETLRRTALGALKDGDRVNLERAMRADGRFGGHMVSGHVDGIGYIVQISPQEVGACITVSVPEGQQRYLIDKGSVALDGISLTVVQPTGNTFDVWLVPHTLANTALFDKGVGAAVNVEFDMVVKYLERLAFPS